MSKNNPLAAALEGVAAKVVKNEPTPQAEVIAENPEALGSVLKENTEAVKQSNEKPVAEAEKPESAEAQESQQQPAAEEKPAVDSGKPWWESGEAGAEDEDEKPEVLAKNYKELLQDPDIALLVEYKKAGKGLNDLTKDFQHVDYDSMDYEKLTREYAKVKGYDEDATEEVVSEISGLGRIAREREVEAMKTFLNSHQDGKRQKLVGGVQQDIQRQQFIQSKFVSDIDRIKTSMVGKNQNGLILSEKDRDEFDAFVKSYSSSIVNKDGTLNAGRLYEFWVGTKISKIQSVNAAHGYAKGAEDILKEVTRPVKSPVQSKLPTEQSQQAKPKDGASLAASIAKAPSAR